MIGVFDSGVGGLTVLAEIKKALPAADVLYFGDSAHAPYGIRSREELTEFTIAALSYLRTNGCTTLVSACNSVSASMAVSLFDMLDISNTQLIEMVGPTVAAFRESPDRLLVCATPATVVSGMYQLAFRMINKQITMCALPELAGHIEDGAAESVIVNDVQVALSEQQGAYDTVLLCCTHYPLAQHVFESVVPEGVRVVNPASAVADRVGRYAWPREVGVGALRFVITKESEVFRRYVDSLFAGQAYTIEVINPLV